MVGRKSHKTVVITGANGLLGQKVVEAFAPHFRVVATGIQKKSVQSRQVEAEYAALDVIDYPKLKDFLLDIRPDVVVNCAGYTSVDKAEQEKDQARKVNATAVKKMVQVLRRMKSKFVQISTDYIFDGTSGPYNESSRPNPLNYYGLTKWEAENAVKASGIDHLIFRTNVLYGVANKVSRNFVLWVMQSLQENKEIRVVDDQLNNPTLANGLAECILMGCVMNVHGVYNYGGTEYLSRYEFARKIAHFFDLPVQRIQRCSSADLNQQADRPLQSGLKTEKVVEDLHIRLYDIQAGLKQVEKDLQKCEI
ncbi:MAG TPA: dTDP-4-dehydrorhamnose reductase [bacterium]|nr:dTDP-4-dehydrorhamnose reductase [bacterium]